MTANGSGAPGSPPSGRATATPGTALGAVGVAIGRLRHGLGQGTGRRAGVRARRAEGRRLTREKLVVRSCVDPATMQDAIVRGIGLPYEKPSRAPAELVQGPMTAGHVQFGYATRALTLFTATIRLEAAGVGGSTLTYGVETWTMTDGVVAGVAQMRFLRRRVEQEARRADPQVDVVVDLVPQRG